MQSTYQNFLKLANLHTGTTQLHEVAKQYQINQDPIYLAYVFCSPNMFPIICLEADKYFYLTESDKASFAVEELHKVMMMFDCNKGMKIQTLFSRNLNYRLRAETQMLDHQNRKSNNGADCYEIVMEVAQGFLESQYGDLEMIDVLTNHANLNKNELRYCQIIMQSNSHTKSSDVALELGISSAAVTYIKQNLARKLTACSLTT